VAASEAAEAQVPVTFAGQRTAVGACLGRSWDLAAVRGAFARARGAVSVTACEVAETNVIARLAVGVGAAGANLWEDMLVRSMVCRPRDGDGGATHGRRWVALSQGAG
jgi:hypothetical protein